MGQVASKGGILSQYAGYLNNVKEMFNFMTHAYKVMPAVNHQLQAEAYKVRHKVYCAELNYEETNESGIETDEFDHHSNQIVVYSRADKSFVGCVRLVSGRHEGQIYDLPFEHHCKGKLNNRVIKVVKESGYKYAEVSRLAIDPEFRHIGRSSSNKSKNRKSKSSSVLMSLYLGIQAIARQQNVRYLFAIVEPRLLNNLHRHNIPAIQIGQGIDHRGLRVPILIDVEDIERIIPSVLRPIYNTIHRDISKLLEPSHEVVSDGDIPPLDLRGLLVASENAMHAN